MRNGGDVVVVSTGSSVCIDYNLSILGLLSKTEEDLSKEEERALEAVRRKREKNSKWGGAMALPVGTDIKVRPVSM